MFFYPAKIMQRGKTLVLSINVNQIDLARQFRQPAIKSDVKHGVYQSHIGSHSAQMRFPDSDKTW